VPEKLTEAAIEYATGLRATAACADDLVTIAVPDAAVLPVKPGCTIGDGPITTILERAQQWLHGLTH
jgi:hypothetical protein